MPYKKFDCPCCAVLSITKFGREISPFKKAWQNIFQQFSPRNLNSCNAIKEPYFRNDISILLSKNTSTDH